jgi:hypothetical protein
MTWSSLQTAAADVHVATWLSISLDRDALMKPNTCWSLATQVSCDGCDVAGSAEVPKEPKQLGSSLDQHDLRLP